MTRTPRLLLFLSPVICLFIAAAPTGYADPAEQALTKQCMEAETSEECKRALLVCSELEATRQKASPSHERDLALAKIWNKLLECEEELDEFTAAEQHGRRALVIRQKLLGPEHLEIAESLNNLGLVLNRQGKFSEAESMHRQGLAMRKKLLGPDHAVISESLGNLSLALERQGKFSEAESFCRQALAVERNLFGVEHRSFAESLQILANILLRQGKYDEAESLDRQALAILQKQLSPEHLAVATVINNLAGVLNRLGKYDEAESLHRQALARRQKARGPEHPDVAVSLSNLAFVLENQGKSEDAESCFRKALAINQKRLGPEHTTTIGNLHNLAVALSHQARYAQAEALFRQTLEIWRKQHGDQHPNVAASLTYLGRLFLLQGRYAAALDPLRKAYRFREAQLRTTVSEPRIKAMTELLRKDEEMGYSLALPKRAQPGGLPLAMTLALLRKGRAVEAGALANRMLHRQFDAPSVRQRFDEWQAVRQQREALLYGGHGKRGPIDHQARLKELQLQADSLEAQLAQELPLVRSLQPPAFDEIVPSVAKRIPKDGVLIEVVWTRPFIWQAKEEASRWGSPHYVALLLTSNQRVAAVDLGDAAIVDGLSRDLLAALRNPGAEPRSAAEAMYRTLFTPLVPHLRGKRQLFLSLDGSLNLIPFDALHDGTDYLLGRYRIHYLTSGRDLLRGTSKRMPQAPILMANPDFGQQDKEPSVEQATSLYQRLVGLSSLPGAQREADVLEPLFEIKALTRGAATEDVLHKLHGPSILHIATHGLFLRDADLDTERPLNETSAEHRSALLMPNSAAPSLSHGAETAAMSRSALVLAGVLQGHHANDTNRDGLLTAEEARSLDLDGTQLVTLSACETGQGGLSAGQGIYGLRRAILIAGAETLVTSLWRVHDEATGELMAIYYKKLLNKNEPGDRLDAMMEAMQELRRHPGRSHPYYWAPFLVIGQDGPLRSPHPVFVQ